MLDFVQKHIQIDADDSSCVCKSHYLDIKRNLCDENYVPKWLRADDYTTTTSLTMTSIVMNGITSKNLDLKRRA